MESGLKTYYTNLVIKLTVLVGGIWLAIGFNPDWKIDTAGMLSAFGWSFPALETESVLFALWFGLYGIIGLIETKYYHAQKAGSVALVLTVPLMLAGFGFAVEEIFINQDFNDMNWWKAVYLGFGTAVYFWLGKDEFVSIRKAKEKYELMGGV